MYDPYDTVLNVKNCADCGKKFRKGSAFGLIFYEDAYLDKEPDTIDIFSGQPYGNILIPAVVCHKCFRNLYKQPPSEEVDLSYKIDEFVIILDHANV